MLLGIDIGTTNSKAGLYTEDGRAVAVESRKTVTHTHAEGYSYYDPDGMWESIASAVRTVLQKAGNPKVKAVGITSMAESGLLVDRETGQAKSPFMPWFDTCSQAQADRIAQETEPFELFQQTGLRNSFKMGLAKLLWIRDRFPEALDGPVTWLSASSYIAYRLSGSMAIDYSLAARTLAFRIDEKRWNREWLAHFGFEESLFPQALPSGARMGDVNANAAAKTGLTTGTPVAVAGHDHVIAALAVGSIAPGVVYDSMGTAETLVGTLEERPLTRKQFDSGLSYGCHVVPDRHFWMGGNSASGGSIEWLRAQFGEEPMSYEQLIKLLDAVKPGPTGILYYPYLSGSGAPSPNPRAKAAFIGFTGKQGKGELIKAVLEGTAYQLQLIRRSAEEIAGSPIGTLLVVGGGTRNRQWLQVKADVLNCSLEVPPIEEATLLGAAMAAGIGCGVYGSPEEAVKAVRTSGSARIEADVERHEAYRKLYDEGYVPMLGALGEFYRRG
ncbi:FGGY-family carbohydrate kinase [Paenibacillus contaminans]|uniref:Carbohydrate kinase n=1 Tax=Paenibacillus contaminans TaxID=450362 RepID=A0A329LYD3_9BACL|nr:FGGY family carbohydrate kinase [Paenibacillus contaminans]RAV12478.1 carbohydrate kinase [Paenibacillus contaminans]